MAFIITEPCIGVVDAGCIDVCPVDCIHPTKENWTPAFKENIKQEQLYIDPEECIDCGACVYECPVNAIYHEDEVPEDQRRFIAINANYFKNKS